MKRLIPILILLLSFNSVLAQQSALDVTFLFAPIWAWIFIPLILMFMFIALTVLIFVFTGPITFPILKAKMTGKSLIGIFKKDKRFIIGGANVKAGMFVTKKSGEYIIIPESIYISQVGSPIGFAYDEFGFTIPIDHVQAATVAKDSDITEYGQLELANVELQKKFIKERNEAPEIIKKIEVELTKNYSDSDKKKLTDLKDYYNRILEQKEIPEVGIQLPGSEVIMNEQVPQKKSLFGNTRFGRKRE